MNNPWIIPKYDSEFWKQSVSAAVSNWGHLFFWQKFLEKKSNAICLPNLNLQVNLQVCNRL